MGLANVGQISRVVIDPYEPSTVLVAALGHVWAPNPDRGVYRTTDGGQTWKKVLYVNDQTGACELGRRPASQPHPVIRLSTDGSWAMSEIGKCIVLCANCHAIQHYEDQK